MRAFKAIPFSILAASAFKKAFAQEVSSQSLVNFSNPEPITQQDAVELQRPCELAHVKASPLETFTPYTPLQESPDSTHTRVAFQQTNNELATLIEVATVSWCGFMPLSTPPLPQQGQPISNLSYAESINLGKNNGYLTIQYTDEFYSNPYMPYCFRDRIIVACRVAQKAIENSLSATPTAEPSNGCTVTPHADSGKASLYTGLSMIGPFLLGSVLGGIAGCKMAAKFKKDQSTPGEGSHRGSFPHPRDVSSAYHRSTPMLPLYHRNNGDPSSATPVLPEQLPAYSAPSPVCTSATASALNVLPSTYTLTTSTPALPASEEHPPPSYNAQS